MMYRRLSSPENGAEIIGGRWRGYDGSLPLPASKRFTTHDSNAFPPPPHHARGYGQRRRQERDRRRALSHLPPGWLPSRALQGAKHGAELLRHRRRSRAGPRAGGSSLRATAPRRSSCTVVRPATNTPRPTSDAKAAPNWSVRCMPLSTDSLPVTTLSSWRVQAASPS